MGFNKDATRSSFFQSHTAALASLTLSWTTNLYSMGMMGDAKNEGEVRCLCLCRVCFSHTQTAVAKP